MSPDALNPLAKVTKQKSPKNARFQCCDVYQLWDNGKVTIDHWVEDEEWGSIEEWREITDTTDYPQDFFKAGCNRVINCGGTIREEPL